MPPRHTALHPHSPPSTQPHLITAPPSSQLYPHHHPHLPPPRHTAPPHHRSTLTTLHPPSTQPLNTAPQHSPPPHLVPQSLSLVFPSGVLGHSMSATLSTHHLPHRLPSPPSALHHLPSSLIPNKKKVSTSQSGPFRINNIIYFMVKSICQRHPRHIACIHHMPANATPRPCKPCRQ